VDRAPAREGWQVSHHSDLYAKLPKYIPSVSMLRPLPVLTAQ
jgi:hypothetical protein